MRKIIDISKLQPDVCLATALDKGESFYSYFYSENRIQNAPTVEAIPIKWIKEWLKKHIPYNNDGTPYIADVYELLEDWEKENEI